MRVGALLAAGFGLLALAGTAAAAPPAQSTDPGERLDLSIRARGLGIAPVTPGADNLGLEAVKAPTGAGSLQMPRPTTEVAPGVYFSVQPLCVPGEDEVLPPRRLPPARRR